MARCDANKEFLKVLVPLAQYVLGLELQELDDRDAKRLDNLRILTDLASGATTGSRARTRSSRENSAAPIDASSPPGAAFDGAALGSQASKTARSSSSVAKLGSPFSRASWWDPLNMSFSVPFMPEKSWSSSQGCSASRGAAPT